MKTPDGRRRLAGVALLAWIGAASCAPEAPPEAPAPEQAEGCISDTQFFLKHVWIPVLERGCYNCHNPQGQARDTNMVYGSPGQVGFLEENLNIFAEMATYERSGERLLLAKPQGKFEHGGGEIFAAGSPELGAIEAMLARLDDPASCGPQRDADADFFEGVTLLSPEASLRKISLNLVGRLPTAEEQALVQDEGEVALEPILDRMMREEAFLSRMEAIWGDLLLTDRYLGGNSAVDLLNLDYYPEARWHLEEGAGEGEDPEFFQAARQFTNNSLAREPLALISFVVRNERPFTEILTADYVAVNPFTARLYGIEGVDFDDPTDPGEWREGRVAGLPHAGVLTSPMFLNRFPTTDTNRNRHRARIVYDYFIATDVLKLAERPIDPTSAAHNPTLNDPQCAACHAVVDPVAGAFQNWDARGNYAPPAEGWYADMRPPGYGKQSVPEGDETESLTWLAERITEDRRFDVSVVHVMFEAITGQAPMGLPRTEDSENYDVELEAYEAQRRFLDTLGRTLRANKHDIKIVVKAIARSPWFLAAGFDGDLTDARRIQLAQLGTGRLLTPEMLNSKLRAVLGEPWRPRADRADYLLDRDQYRLLYGGIDFNDVTERITDPNGIMASVQLRMANELACQVTARDFTREVAERRFFKGIELTYIPEDEHGFAIGQAVTAIKKAIVELHWSLLGERVALGSPEVEATYALFFDTWKEGMAAIKAGELGNALDNACRARVDLVTGRDLPPERRIENDPRYTVRAWMAVMTYLLSDYRFLYE